jgi:hypothetical protein
MYLAMIIGYLEEEEKRWVNVFSNIKVYLIWKSLNCLGNLK